MDNKPQKSALITKEELFFLFLACLFFGGIYVLESQLPTYQKIIWSALIISLFYSPIIFSRFGFIEGSLNRKIFYERKRLSMGKSSGWQWHSSFRIYNPSIISAMVIVAFGLLINFPAFYFPWFKIFLSIDPKDAASYFSNLIAIHAGIGAIIFALLIFVAESLRDDTKDRASVLLKESMLFPLTFLEIITFLALVEFNYQNLLAVIPVFFVGLLASYSLYKLMKILLSSFEFQKKRLTLLTDRVSGSINEAINERIGGNILHKFLGAENFSIKAGYLGGKDKKEYIIFKINKIGIVKDINMEILSLLGDFVEAEANKNGYSFFEKKSKPLVSSPQEAGVPREVEYYIKLQRWDAGLTKFYHDRLGPESNDVLIISKKVSGESKVFEEKVNNLLDKLLVTGKASSSSEEIKLELETLRDQFVEAIQQIKITKIDYFKDVYLSLADSFLELISQCGGTFTAEQAKQEMSSFSNSWSEIFWLDDHLRDVFLASLKTKDKEMIYKVAYIPISVAIRGVRKNDHFLFQKFIKYAQALHYQALELEGSETLKKDISERSITWLKEVNDYYVEPELENEPNKIQFALQLLLQFQNIIKHSFDKNDFDSFEHALDVYNTLLKRFKPSEEYPNATFLEMDFKSVQDPKQKEDIKERLDIQQKLENLEKNYRTKKQQLIFGLTSWIFKKIRKSNLDIENKKRYFEKLRTLIPTDISKITDLFIEVIDHDVQSYFGWDWWDIIPDGEVRMMNFSDDIESFYIFLVLESLKNKTPEEIGVITLPPSRELASMAENNSSIHRKLSDLGIIPNFDQFISVQARQKTEALKSLIEKARKDQEEIERKEIMEKSISSNRVEEFIKLFLKEFYGHTSLRSLFVNQGKLEDKTHGVDISPVQLWGYNQIERKEAFFESWHVSYGGWGQQYGEGFARSEDGLIYKRISENLSNKKHISFIDLIPEVEKTISKDGFTKPILFSPFANSLEMQTLRSSEKFVAGWDNRKDHMGLNKYSFYVGYLDFKTSRIPIFRVINGDNTKRDACLVDMNRIGTLTQYPPIKELGDKDFQKDIFMFKIIDLNLDEEKRKKIIDDKPKWLEDKIDSDSYLRGKVLLNIYSKVEFNVTDSEAGIYFTFKEKEEELY
ncbi:MAG: hypothetical protein WC757_03060 [Candidatus Paceibacterota bacterium]|jgi:hypothetical protein